MEAQLPFKQQLDVSHLNLLPKHHYLTSVFKEFQLFHFQIISTFLPNSWKSSLSVPVHKSGDSSNPSNYRPLSLLLIKLREKHICDFLCEHFYTSNQQWGFQDGKSTTNAILWATNEWFIHLENGTKAVFFDLQKAFDSVPLECVSSYGYFGILISFWPFVG